MDPAGKKTEQAAPLPTVPSVEAWRAMTPGQQLDFQLRVLDALSESKAEQAEEARVRAEEARVRAEEAQAQERASTQARAVLTVLRVRSIAVPDAERARILAETDAERLERWLEKAAAVGSLAEVLAEPTSCA